MSSSIAPLPNGLGVTVIAEHRQRQEPEPRRPGEKDRREETRDAADERHSGHGQHNQPPPVVDEESVPAETLFATALIANELPHAMISPQELKLRTGHGWLPPDSSLRLKDKLI
jgi:hypothetical protein